MLAVGAVLFALGAAGARWVLTRPVPAAAPVRFTLDLPSGSELVVGPKTAVISPDGSKIVVTAGQRGEDQQLMLRPLDSMEAKPIAGTTGGYNPFFSPDGGGLRSPPVGSFARCRSRAGQRSHWPKPTLAAAIGDATARSCTHRYKRRESGESAPPRAASPSG